MKTFHLFAIALFTVLLSGCLTTTGDRFNNDFDVGASVTFTDPKTNVSGGITIHNRQPGKNVVPLAGKS